MYYYYRIRHYSKVLAITLGKAVHLVHPRESVFLFVPREIDRERRGLVTFTGSAEATRRRRGNVPLVVEEADREEFRRS